MPQRRRIYFARAVEGMSRSYIEQLAVAAQEDIEAANLEFVDPHEQYLTWKQQQNGHEPNSDECYNLIPFQLDVLKSCHAVLMDMTIANRNYVGCCSELVYAKIFRLVSVVYVGDTDYYCRNWLRFHAETIVRDRRQAINYLQERLSHSSQEEASAARPGIKMYTPAVARTSYRPDTGIAGLGQV